MKVYLLLKKFIQYEQFFLKRVNVKDNSFYYQLQIHFAPLTSNKIKRLQSILTKHLVFCKSLLPTSSFKQIEN